MNITSKFLLAAALLFAVSATAQTHVKPLERDIEIPIVDNRRSPIPKYLQMKPDALLGSNSRGDDMEFKTPAAALSNIGALFSKTVAKSANYTVTEADRGTLFLVTTGASNKTITLPDADDVGDGFTVGVMKVDTGVGIVDTGLDFTGSLSIKSQWVVCVSDGTNWRSLNNPAVFDDGSVRLTNGGPSDETHGVSVTADGFVYLGDGVTTVLSTEEKTIFGGWSVNLSSGETGSGPSFAFNAAVSGASFIQKEVWQNRVATTSATVTTIHTVAVPASSTLGVSGFVTARRTGGASGTAEDGAFYRVEFVAKGNAGNNAALIGSATVTTVGESQAGWNVTATASAGNVLIQVTGAASNNVTWHFTGDVFKLSN